MPCYRRMIAMLWQIAAPGLAGAAPVPAAAPTHITASLLAESGGAPGGQVLLAIRMQPAPGWHGYWSNPGDAGFGMRLDWNLPAGAGTGVPQYPVPDTLLESGLMNHVYRRDYAVLVPLTLPKNARRGTTLPLRVQADWLACTEQICVPERAALTAMIAVEPQAPSHDARFAGWRARLPAALGAEAHMAVDQTSIRLAVPLPAGLPLAHPHLFAATDRLIDYAARQRFARSGNTLVITLARAKFQPLTPTRFPAVLRLDDSGGGVGFTAIPGPVPSGGIPLADGTPAARSDGWAVAGAMIALGTALIALLAWW